MDEDPLDAPSPHGGNCKTCAKPLRLRDAPVCCECIGKIGGTPPEHRGTPFGGTGIQPHMRCYGCGKEEAKSMCARCKVARYCSRECQKSHWPSHKMGCNRDAAALARKEIEEAPVKESDVYHVDGHCLHGAPGIKAGPVGPAMVMLMGSLRHFMHDRVGSLNMLEDFCRSNPHLACQKGAAKVAVSHAVDAFGDSERGLAAYFLRTAIFLDAYRKGGTGFLEALRSQDDRVTNEVMAEYLQRLESTASRAGMIKYLQASVNCKCMTPTVARR